MVGTQDSFEIIGLFFTLIAANWAALDAALKCRDKIDRSRNLLLGIGGNTPPRQGEVTEYVIKSDIAGFTIALVLVFCAVGILLLVAAVVMCQLRIPKAIVYLYGIDGILFMIGGIVVAVSGKRGYERLRELIAATRLGG